LKFVAQLNLFGNSNTILGDYWSAKTFVDHDITSFGSESHFHCFSECIDALFYIRPSIISKINFKGTTVNKDDIVLFGKYHSGENIEIDGEEHIIIKESELLAVINK
jgi:hypothetical protein